MCAGGAGAGARAEQGGGRLPRPRPRPDATHRARHLAAALLQRSQQPRQVVFSRKYCEHIVDPSIARGSRILAESQVVQEAVDIPGSAVRLMYHSSRAKGYYSTIQLQLTPDTVPESLVRVHLVISIEGVLEQKLFEADPRLQHTYYWDRLNIYRQRVSSANIFTVSKYFYSEPIFVLNQKNRILKY